MRSDRRLDGLPGSGRLYSPSQCDSEQVVEVGDAGTEVTATVPDPTVGGVGNLIAPPGYSPWEIVDTTRMAAFYTPYGYTSYGRKVK